MIIFGTRGVTTTPEKGEFHCPSCNSKQPYGLKRVRRFFTLYFIPVIPLDKLGEYVECRTCKDTYKPVVLQYDPNANAQQVEAEYHTAIKKVMIHMLLADGVIDDSEVETTRDIYSKLTGKDVSTDEIRNEINHIQNTREDLSKYLTKLQGSLNDEGKEMVVRAAMFVALADGEFHEDEKALVGKVGSDLGMTDAHVFGVMSSTQAK